MNELRLPRRRRTDGDAHHGNAAVASKEPGDQACLRAGTAGYNDDMIDTQSHLGRLLQQFEGAGNVAEGAHRAGAAAGDDIGAAALRTQRRGMFLHRQLHIAAGRQTRDDLGAEKFIE